MDVLTNKLVDFGNRCRHTPDCPQLFSRPQSQKKTFSTLHIATENLAEYYHHPIDSWLPNLHAIRETRRRQRSERREAIASIARVMVNHLDMASMKIVRAFNGELVEMSVKELAIKANIHLRRAERALRDLRHANYLELKYRVEHLPDGTIKPKVAIKRLTALFFYHLGISFEKLKKESERAKAQFKRFNKKARMKAAELKSTTEQFFGSFLKKPNYRPKRPYHETPEYKRRQADLWYQLQQQHPDWTHEAIKSHAESLLRG